MRHRLIKKGKPEVLRFTDDITLSDDSLIGIPAPAFQQDQLMNYI